MHGYVSTIFAVWNEQYMNIEKSHPNSRQKCCDITSREICNCHSNQDNLIMFTRPVICQYTEKGNPFNILYTKRNGKYCKMIGDKDLRL